MDTIQQSSEWKITEFVLSGKTSKRTSAVYFDHVEEGVEILKILEAPLIIQKAFCIHPLFQLEETLSQNIIDYAPLFDPIAVAYTMEYCRVANNGIRTNLRKNNWNITLSKIPDVNKMLMADKIQNRKLFLEKYRKERKDYSELEFYFNTWMGALGINETVYNLIVGKLKKQPKV